jgi:hypothetical protein
MARYGTPRHGPNWTPNGHQRSERGNSATNYDASPAKTQKTLRGQFGKFYDQKKVLNSSPSSPHPPASDVATRSTAARTILKSAGGVVVRPHRHTAASSPRPPPPGYDGSDSALPARSFFDILPAPCRAPHVVAARNNPTMTAATFSDHSGVNSPKILRSQSGPKYDVN